MPIAHDDLQQSKRALLLTEDEALALLEVCLYSEAEDDPLKSRLLAKVAEVCRDFIRAEEAEFTPIEAEEGERSYRIAVAPLDRLRFDRVGSRRFAPPAR